MKSAVVGLGVIGSAHLEILLSNSQEIIALCDVDESKALELKKRHNLSSKVYTSFNQMLNNQDIEVVHICTPHYLHAQMIIECLNRDISVLCEKPMCIKESEIQRILLASKKSKGVLGICHQNRFIPVNRFLKEYLKDKEIESVHGSVVWHRDKSYYQSAEWRGKWNTEGGGVLINQALHTLDLLQWLSVMPESCVANINNFSLQEVIEVEDTAYIQYNGKTPFSFFATVGAPADFPVEMRFRLKNGSIINAYPELVLCNNQIIFNSKTDDYFVKKSYGSGHKTLIKEFYDCVENDRKFCVDGEEGAKVIKLILSAYKSKGQITEIIK